MTTWTILCHWIGFDSKQNKELFLVTKMLTHDNLQVEQMISCGLP
jgi:hypothetical protein